MIIPPARLSLAHSTEVLKNLVVILHFPACTDTDLTAHGLGTTLTKS